MIICWVKHVAYIVYKYTWYSTSLLDVTLRFWVNKVACWRASYRAYQWRTPVWTSIQVRYINFFGLEVPSAKSQDRWTEVEIADIFTRRRRTLMSDDSRHGEIKAKMRIFISLIVIESLLEAIPSQEARTSPEERALKQQALQIIARGECGITTNMYH